MERGSVKDDKQSRRRVEVDDDEIDLKLYFLPLFISLHLASSSILSITLPFA